jgi:hypothetical protein
MHYISDLAKEEFNDGLKTLIHPVGELVCDAGSPESLIFLHPLSTTCIRISVSLHHVGSGGFRRWITSLIFT